MIANDESYNQSQRRFLPILAKTLPPSTMGFGRTGAAASIPNLTIYLHSLRKWKCYPLGNIYRKRGAVLVYYLLNFNEPFLSEEDQIIALMMKIKKDFEPEWL